MRYLFVSIFLTLFATGFVYADERATGSQFKALEKRGDLKEDFETVVVEKKRLRYSEKVGSYNQPAWTAKRRFPTTRVYVIPEDAVEVEYWLLMEGGLSENTDPKYTGIYEIEFGLGHRLQLDLYLKTLQKDSNAPIEIIKENIELRYAMFDWGKVFGNPTIYVEWIRQSGRPQKIEAKLLLGDGITERLFWGANLIFERGLGGESVNEYGISAGLAYSVIDGIFSAGLETKIIGEDNQSDRFNLIEKKFLLGPSALYTPLPPIHIIFTPLFGYKIEEENGKEEGKGIYAIYFIVGANI